MRTKTPGIFGAGDCAEAHHLVTGKAAFIPLGTTAYDPILIAATVARKETFRPDKPADQSRTLSEVPGSHRA
jgi:thioredoxin reductase